MKASVTIELEKLRDVVWHDGDPFHEKWGGFACWYCSSPVAEHEPDCVWLLEKNRRQPSPTMTTRRKRTRHE